MSGERPGESLRSRVWELLEVTQDEHSGVINWDWVDVSLLVLILLNVVAVIIETIPSIGSRFHVQFLVFDYASVAVFTIEYAVRVWASTVDPRYKKPFVGRLRYALSFNGLVDLLAILPFYAALLTPATLLDLRFLRILRLMRFVRVLKIGRYSEAMDRLKRVYYAKRSDLAVALAGVLVVLVVASSLMFHVENAAQPEAFSSIPAAMWWGISTLTTVGYGDVAPITALGKLLGGFIQLLGVALFALPAGIIASGYEEESRRRRTKDDICPTCGRSRKDDESGAESD